MSRLSFFSRQMGHLRSGNRGQAATLFLVTTVLLLSLVFSSVYLSHQGILKVSSSNRIDAIALSAATWEARGLNLIAALNDGVYQCIKVIRWIAAIWAVLAVAASTGYGAALFSAYSDYAEEVIRNLWSRARELSDWAEQVKEATPALALGESIELGARLNVVGILRPANPGGPHDGEETLELHLKRGEAIGLAEALSPILNVLGSGVGSAIKAILNPILAVLLGTSTEPIRLLVPEDDFNERQYVTFAGYFDQEGLSLPFLGPVPRRRFTFSTSACPYGGTSTDMTWNSRLFERADPQ